MKNKNNLSKYTVYGTNAIDKDIENHLKNISNRVSQIFRNYDLIALVLGGGYGKGEGGVYLENGKETLFNDLDFFIIIDDIPQPFRDYYENTLKKLHKELSKEIGIDVDFGPLKTLKQIEKMPFNLMWGELKQSHQVIIGNKDILQWYPHKDLQALPHKEALNLLLNRGVGLLLAKDQLENPSKIIDKDFILRNIYKARIAIGDALLILNNLFHHSYLKRADLFEKLQTIPNNHNSNLQAIYRDAIDYKLKPNLNFSQSELQNLYSETLKIFEEIYFYAFELFFNTKIPDLKTYRSLLENLENKNKLKNFVLNNRTVGFIKFDSRLHFKHPRYRLFYSLPLFLFGEKHSHKFLSEVLNKYKNTKHTHLKESFYNIWKKHN
jgi:hypothetical protein